MIHPHGLFVMHHCFLCSFLHLLSFLCILLLTANKLERHNKSILGLVNYLPLQRGHELRTSLFVLTIYPSKEDHEYTSMVGRTQIWTKTLHNDTDVRCERDGSYRVSFQVEIQSVYTEEGKGLGVSLAFWLWSPPPLVQFLYEANWKAMHAMPTLTILSYISTFTSYLSKASHSLKFSQLDPLHENIMLKLSFDISHTYTIT